MADKQFQFIKPTDWKIIKPERYRDFSILSTELVPCVYGFAVPRKTGGYDVVSMFDYGESSSEFINELNSEINKLKENNKNVGSVNDFIKENADGYAVTETSSMKPILNKALKIHGKNVYVNIMEIATNVGRSFSIQLFVKLEKNLVCLGTSVPKVDTSRPLESAVQNYPFVADLVNILIKSLKTSI